MKQLFILSILGFLCNLSTGQNAQNLLDIHQPVEHPFESLNNFYKVNGKVIFHGLTYGDGFGIWSYDGENITKISEYGSLTGKPAETSDGFYFLSHYDVNKYTLYKHGGTPGVTINLADVKSFSQNYIPSLAELNGKVYFPNWNQESGYELWSASDFYGSASLVLDGQPGSGSIFPTELTEAENLIYYRGGGGNGKQLWRSDGTENGTFKLLHINSTTQNIQNNSLRTNGDKAWFLVKNNSGATELWTSDGSIAGTIKAMDVPASYAVLDRFEAFIHNGKYVYLAGDAANGSLNWVASDGTLAGTEMLLNLPAGTEYNLSFYNPETVKSILNGYFFFFCRNVNSNEYALWKSDGTAAGSQLVKSLGDAGNPQALASTKLQYFFLTQHKTSSEIELWTSDGTEAGTKLCKTMGVPEQGLYYGIGEAIDSSILIQKPILNFDDPEQPFRSDGTEQGTYLLDGRLDKHLAGSFPDGFTAGPQGDVYFLANDHESYGIWRTDPDAGFEMALLDTSAQLYYKKFAVPIAVADKVMWIFENNEIAVVDGGGVLSSIPLPVTHLGDRSKGPGEVVYVIADYGKSLWRTDGTVSGTYEMITAPTNSVIDGLLSMGDSLYFVQRYQIQNNPSQQLWSSDGTANGSQVIQPIENGSTVFLRKVEDRVAYSVNGIWPDSRTLYVQGFPAVNFPGYWGDDFLGLAIANNQLLVLGGSAYDPVDSLHFPFWVIENDMPVILKKFKALSAYQYFVVPPENHLVTQNNKVLFGAGTDTRDVELWTSDGSENGTFMLRDINPNGSSNPKNFIRYNDHLWLFTANDGTDVAWWATNGSADGTFKVAALSAVKDYFVPNVDQAYLHGQHIYFSMNDGILGQEPWVLELEDSLKVSTLTPLHLQHDLKLWPNPAGETLQLELPSQAGMPVWVEISNSLGQVWYRQKQMMPTFGPLSIPLPTRSAGTNFLQLRAGDGKIWSKKLLIIE